MFINRAPFSDAIEARVIEIRELRPVDPNPEVWAGGEEFDVPGVGRVRVCGDTAYVVAAAERKPSSDDGDHVPSHPRIKQGPAALLRLAGGLCFGRFLPYQSNLAYGRLLWQPWGSQPDLVADRRT